jgi:small subunit ribosomal protein S8
MKAAIAQILLEEAYISRVEMVEDDRQGLIHVTLKYVQKKPVISGIKRISRPGLRVYAGKEELPKVLNGLGIAIVSTSQGLMTDKKARNAGVGGEVLAYVW